MTIQHMHPTNRWNLSDDFRECGAYSSDPAYLHMKDNFHLVDAGLLLNVAYPSFLGNKRDIDLIIVPEFRAGNIFESLIVARDHAAELRKPFPEIDEKILKEKNWPRDCYVFEGKKKTKEPTIVFMPLFNRKNCKDAEEVKVQIATFCTFHLPYSPEMIESLMEMRKRT